METINHSKDIQRRNRGRIDIGTTLYGKIPPQSRECEEAILGAILIEKTAYDRAAEILRPECFYVDSHQRIFKAMQFLDNNRQPIDYLTLIEALKIAEDLEAVGGPYAITKLTNNVVSSANIEIHARIVLEKFVCREMIRLSGDTITAAYEDSTDFHELMDNHDKQLSQIITGSIQKSFTDTRQVGASEIDRIYYLQQNPQTITGVTTGFPVMNKLTCGWQPTDLIILAARPSVGKTALALNMARAASADGTVVGFFSLEMSKGQLMRRLLSAESGIYLAKINNGKATTDEINTILLANERLNINPIHIDDTGGIGIYELRSKARRMVTKYGVKIIFVDYLQLMSGEDGKNTNREQEISKISRDLKALAKELNVPIIALSQLNRANETQKREPQLSDLRESGAIEQDADVVMFAMRDDYQVIDEGEVSNTGYIKFSKHRNGPLDKLAFKTDMRIQTWFDITQWDNYIRNNSNLPF